MKIIKMNFYSQLFKWNSITVLNETVFVSPEKPTFGTYTVFALSGWLDIKCNGQRRPCTEHIFSAFSSTGKCGSFLRLRLIQPCHMIVQNGDYSGHKHFL